MGSNIFKFDDEMRIQLIGTSMGTTVAPIKLLKLVMGRNIFKFDDDILLNLKKLEVGGVSLSDSIYRLRANEMGPTGDRIFCYKRVEVSSGSLENNRISKRESIRHHVEIAARKS